MRPHSLDACITLNQLMVRCTNINFIGQALTGLFWATEHYPSVMAIAFFMKGSAKWTATGPLHDIGSENLQQLNINQTLVSWYTAHIEVWTRYIWCKASEVCLYFPLTMTSPFLVENLIWISGLRHYQPMIVAVPFNHSQDNICKLNICLISPSPKCAKTREINRLWWESNLISFEGGQDTWVCQIWHHFFHVPSRKCQETPQLTPFFWAKLCPN